MPLSFDGAGIITGLQVGGLPDGTVDQATLATDSVATAKIEDDAVTVGKTSFTGDLQFNSGFGSAATAYGVRAWINFDGTAATIGTGRGSANMDAVTDNATGDYTVNFTNDMPDANYCVAGICFETGSTGATDNFIGIKRATNYSDSVTAGSVRIATNGGGNRSCFVMIVR